MMYMNQHSINQSTGQVQLICEIVCHLLQGIRGMHRPDGLPGDLDIYIETKLTSNGGYFAYFLALLRYQRVLSEPVGCVDRMLCESNLVTLVVAHVTVFEIGLNYWNTLNHVVSDRQKIVNLDYLAINDWYVRFKTNDHYEYSEKGNTDGFEFDSGKEKLVIEDLASEAVQST